MTIRDGQENAKFHGWTKRLAITVPVLLKFWLDKNQVLHLTKCLNHALPSPWSKRKTVVDLRATWPFQYDHAIPMAEGFVGAAPAPFTLFIAGQGETDKLSFPLEEGVHSSF